MLCPQTFMNQSGRSVKACLDFYGISPKDLLVVHDDLDLPLGRIKVVRGGGSGGHKGVTSVIAHAGTLEFARVKIGIGRPRRAESIEQYVLSPFYGEERPVVEEVLRTAIQACELFVSEGVDSAMNQINRQNIGEKEVIN